MWQTRIAAVNELLETPDLASGRAWCEAHPDIVNEGYSFSKECIVVYTMRQSPRLIARGIRINCISPGPTTTATPKNYCKHLSLPKRKPICCATN